MQICAGCKSHQIMAFSTFFLDRSEEVAANGQDVIDNISALKKLLAPNCNKNALSRLPAGVVTDKVLIVDMLKIKDDWQDDHRWTATSGAKEKKYGVILMKKKTRSFVQQTNQMMFTGSSVKDSFMIQPATFTEWW